VACPDAEAKESANASHFTAAGAREIRCQQTDCSENLQAS
jgi:hypothetical protein